MRAIADAASMRAASIHYHFASKDDLLVAVHEEALQRISEATSTAIRDDGDPWERLENACAPTSRSSSPEVHTSQR